MMWRQAKLVLVVLPGEEAYPSVVQQCRAVMWCLLVLLVGEEAHPSVAQRCRAVIWCLLVLVSEELHPSVVQGCRNVGLVGEELHLGELDPLVLVKEELHLVVLAREELPPSVPQEARPPSNHQEQPVVRQQLLVLLAWAPVGWPAHEARRRQCMNVRHRHHANT